MRTMERGEQAEYIAWFLGQMDTYVKRAAEAVDEINAVDPKDYEAEYPGAHYAAAFGTAHALLGRVRSEVHMMAWLIERAKEDGIEEVT